MSNLSNPVNIIPLPDFPIVSYADTGLGTADSQDFIFDGRDYRAFTIDAIITSGSGTVTLKWYESGEDVASGSVANWTDESTANLGATSVTSTTRNKCQTMARHHKLEVTISNGSNDSALSLYIWQGVGGGNGNG